MTKSFRAAPAVFILTLLTACGGGSPVPQPQRVVDLSPPMTYDINLSRIGAKAVDFLGTNGKIEYEPLIPRDAAYVFGMDTVKILSHSGSHVDTPSRLLRGGAHPFQIPIDQLVGPAKVIDLRWHDNRSPVLLTDLEGTPIVAGDIVILFLGYTPPVGDKFPLFAGITPQTAEWFAAKKIKALATDMPALVTYAELSQRMDAKQIPELVWAEYLPLFQAQIPVLLGLVNLDKIAEESLVQFVGLPLPLTDSSGAPVRAAALVY